MDIYRELILDHYKHPRNYGHLPVADAAVDVGNASCGDTIHMEILGKDRIENIAFSGEGCAISIASASLLTEKVKGMAFADVIKLQTHDIITLLGTQLTPSRTKCAVLPLEVLTKAIWMITTQK